MRQLCIDVGGTFTDCLVLDSDGSLYKFKGPTTPDDPTRGFFEVVGKASRYFGQTLGEFLSGVDRIVHGTTLGINTLLTERGARVGMITTRGFRDVVEMRRGIKNLRGSMFDLFIEPYQPLVPRYLRLGVEERTLYTGQVLTPLDEDETRQAVQRLLGEGCTAVALCFLHSYANGENERRARAIVEEMAPDLYVTTSHEILPTLGEFERFSTAVVSAYIGPAVVRYLQRLENRLRASDFSGSLFMMLSNGLVQTADYCTQRAVYLLGSGPAAAPFAAAHLGRFHGRSDLISMDMGGTSFDVCVIKDLQVPTTTEAWVGEHRVAIKMMDVASVGAGGGSIAWLDSLGLLRVGPQSAGADPGPAAYGRGDQPTVTDADLILGYIPADYFLGGEIQLDVERARAAVGRLGSRLGMGVVETAQAIYTTVNTVMADKITEVCTKQGHDLRDFTLVAGGGAGGVHAAAIAERLSIPEIIVPRFAALMSAFGMFTMDLGLEFARSRYRTQSQISVEEVRALYEEMRQEAERTLAHHGLLPSSLRYFPTVDMRYLGQFHEIEVELPEGEVTEETIRRLVEQFHQQHHRLYTYSIPWQPVEFLNFRLRVTTAGRQPAQLVSGSPLVRGLEVAERGIRPCIFGGQERATPVYDWDRLQAGHVLTGPALVEDHTTTVLVPPGFQCQVDPYGNLVLRTAVEV